MEADSWTDRLSSTATRYQFVFPTRSDMFLGLDDIDGDDDFREEFPCPFCSDYLDIVALCCHIEEEHSMEERNGVCPICEVRVGIDMVAHITHQHGNIFKVQRKRKIRRGGSSTLSLLKRELREGNLPNLFGGPSCIVTASNAAPDPLLSSFISPMAEDYVAAESQLCAENVTTKKSSNENVTEGDKNAPCVTLSTEDKEEKTKKSEFVQMLLMSTVLDDIL